MSTFDSLGLVKSINENLGPFRKSQGDAMQGFAQLAKASMAELPRPGLRTSPISNWPSAGKPSFSPRIRMPGRTQSSGTAPTASPDCTAALTALELGLE